MNERIFQVFVSSPFAFTTRSQTNGRSGDVPAAVEAILPSIEVTYCAIRSSNSMYVSIPELTRTRLNTADKSKSIVLSARDSVELKSSKFGTMCTSSSVRVKLFSAE